MMRPPDYLFLPMEISRGKPVSPARAPRGDRGKHQLKR